MKKIDSRVIFLLEGVYNSKAIFLFPSHVKILLFFLAQSRNLISTKKSFCRIPSVVLEVESYWYAYINELTVHINSTKYFQNDIQSESHREKKLSNMRRFQSPYYGSPTTEKCLILRNDNAKLDNKKNSIHIIYYWIQLASSHSGFKITSIS
jgi:hypothetical protein